MAHLKQLLIAHAAYYASLIKPDCPGYTASDYRLSLLFMAASPHGQQTLDYRGEEVAISEAGASAGLDLSVEELGSAKALRQRLVYLRQRDGSSPDCLHLSCHGGFDKDGEAPEPKLLLENDIGGAQWLSAGELVDLGATGCKLVFLSACHTAEQKSDDDQPQESMAQQLLSLGVAVVVGWDGAVADSEATFFAQVFYRCLNEGLPLAEALRQARGELQAQWITNGSVSRDWHLPRLYLSEHAGHGLSNGQRARRALPANYAEDEFLDKNGAVKVAPYRVFVGRRAELQSCLRAFNAG